MENYPHQQKVADLILLGKNVILQAPTGAGKTRAALLPFLESWHKRSDVYGSLPIKCIYSVPMRILAQQFLVEHEKTVRKYTTKQALDKLAVKIQTGESQDDPYFAGNLIFATIDQLLSSFLISPYSLSRRKANLNAGAILSSYLVFDEFHLFDPNSTLPTTLHMLKMLKGITPFVLMTATFSRTMLDELATELDAEIVGQSDEERAEFANLPSQNKKRFYRTINDALTADAVLDEHKGRSLVICNTVDRARKLYEAINARKNPETEVILLHSRFLPDDRHAREESIRTKFGQKSAQKAEGDFIVVSTQAIEVGVDMTSTVLHTELAPANAIIQRAGRCARYEGEKGHVYIYRRAIKDDEVIDLCEDVMPYQGQEEVIIKTWEAFEDVDNNKPLAFTDEQEILSHAHEDQDKQTIQRLRETNSRHRQEMYGVMRGDKNEDARNLIRAVMSQQVTIHDNPDDVAKNLFAYPSFGLHPGTVQGHLKDWIDRRNHKSQIAIIQEKDDKDSEAIAQANEERYEARALENDAREGFMAKLLVIHPDLATYDEKLGFIAEHGGKWQAEINPKTSNERSKPDIRYKLETYERHIELVYQAFTECWKEAQWAAEKLEKRFGWETGSVTKAAQLAILLHDVGKLSKGWQGWVRKYQQALIENDVVDNLDEHKTFSGQAYAHTDSRSDNDRYREIANSIRPPRPWHAVEGAYSVLDILMDELNENEFLARAAYSAIARHHTAHSKEHQRYQLEEDAIKHIATTFKGRLPEPKWSSLYGLDDIVDAHSDAPDYIITAVDLELAGFLVYTLIVRALRRADVEGTKANSNSRD